LSAPICIKNNIKAGLIQEEDTRHYDRALWRLYFKPVWIYIRNIAGYFPAHGRIFMGEHIMHKKETKKAPQKTLKEKRKEKKSKDKGAGSNIPTS
jgi:hypothetical protein